jgi:hypothetical protein
MALEKDMVSSVRSGQLENMHSEDHSLRPLAWEELWHDDRKGQAAPVESGAPAAATGIAVGCTTLDPYVARRVSIG